MPGWREGCSTGRIRDRYKLWANSGLSGLRLNSLNDESLKVFATVEKG